MYLSKLEYSGVFNKLSGMFITFWLFSPPVRLYLDHYINFFTIMLWALRMKYI